MPRFPRPVEVADRLEAAADLLEQKGWCTGDFVKGDRHCAIGAIEAVTKVFSTEDAAIRALEAELDSHSIAVWNDEQNDRRKVVRAMRRAARHVRSRKIVRHGVQLYDGRVVDRFVKVS